MLRFIKLVNNLPTHYTIEQLFEEYPDAVIYEGYGGLPSERLLKEYDIYPLITTIKPEGDIVEEGEPIFSNGEWIQTWTIRDFTKSELEEQKRQFELKQINSEKESFFRPFLENNNIFVDKEMQNYRYNICKSCDKFINLTKQCKECGCFMTLKTRLKLTSCPIGKWDSDLK
jgi:hypothetical protein